MYIISFLHQTTTTTLKPLVKALLYIISFLHQTTTNRRMTLCARRLYIISFLHQTTTIDYDSSRIKSCISFHSYIKPQHVHIELRLCAVVYHFIPTSNHNYTHTTSDGVEVVYHFIPTSNHNARHNRLQRQKLYIISFLHQTTTVMT